MQEGDAILLASVVGDGRVGNMELVDIDAIQTQALETTFHRFRKVPGTRIVGPLSGATALPSSLSGDHQTGWTGVEANSTARRRVASAAALSSGGPQIPLPVILMAP